MPSPSEAPSGGAKRFWLLLALFKSDPPGGTLSSRYRSNGYVPGQAVIASRLAHRFTPDPQAKMSPFSATDVSYLQPLK